MQNRDNARRLIAVMRHRGNTLRLNSAGKIAVDGPRITPDIRAAMQHLRDDVAAVLASPLLQLDPDAPAIAFDFGEFYIDDRPEWMLSARDRRQQPGSIHEPQHACNGCAGVTFRYVQSGLWICPKCRPEFKPSHTVRTITLKTKGPDVEHRKAS